MLNKVREVFLWPHSKVGTRCLSASFGVTLSLNGPVAHLEGFSGSVLVRHVLEVGLFNLLYTGVHIVWWDLEEVP